MAVSDAVVGAGAVVAGVLVTGAFSILNDRRRRRWEDDRRWADRKRERYLDLLAASREVMDAIREVGKGQIGLLDRLRPGDTRRRRKLPGDPDPESDPAQWIVSDPAWWAEFEAGQHALSEQVLREQVLRQAYSGWDELEILAPDDIQRGADEHFGVLTAWRGRLLEAGETVKASEHPIPGFQVVAGARSEREGHLPAFVAADYERAFRQGLEAARPSRARLVQLVRQDLRPQRGWWRYTRRRRLM
jgi:hypothetical protein